MRKLSPLFKLPIFFIVFRMLSNESGLCITKLQFNNNDEILKILIQNNIKKIHYLEASEYHNNNFSEEDSLYTLNNHENGELNRKTLAYKSVDEFFSLNPSCCRIPGYDEGQFDPGVLNYMLGYSTSVSWKYKNKYIFDTNSYLIETNPNGPRTDNASLYITNCGKVKAAPFPLNPEH